MKASEVKKNSRINKKYLYYQSLAEDVFNKEDYKNAALYLDTAINFNAYSDKLYEMRAVSLMSLNQDPKLVFSDANKALELNNSNSEALRLRAHINIVMNRLVDAENDIKELIKIDSVNKKTFFVLGEFFSYKRDFKKAIEYFGYAIKLDSNHLASIQQRGLILEFINEHDLSMNDYRLLTKIAPKNSVGYRLKAGLFLKNQLYDSVISNLNFAIEFDSTNWDFYYWRAMATIQKGFMPENTSKLASYNGQAFDDFKKALKLNPNELNSISGIARIFAFNNELDSSLYYYDKLISLNPIELNYYERAFVHFRLTNYERAKNDFDQVLKNNPANYLALEGHAFANMILGQINSAIDEFESVINKNPNFITSIFGLGYSYYLNNDHSNAKITFLSSLKSSSSIDTTNYLLNFLEYKRMDPLIKNLLGECNYKLEKNEEAIESFESALIDDSSYSTPYFNLGLTYLKLGKQKKACQNLKLAEGLGYDSEKIVTLVLKCN